MYISTTLPYTAETLAVFIASYNHAIWPAHIFAALLIIVSLIGLFKPFSRANRVTGLVLTLFWIWNGLVFYILEFSALNFLAPLYGGFFLVQASMLFVLCAIQNKLSFQSNNAPRKWLTISLLILSIVAYPAGVVFYEQKWESLRFAGTTPLATSLFTIGLLYASQGKKIIKGTLAIIPVLHIITSSIVAFLLMR